MAKKKDITRNPPSWIEKGLFVVVILLIVAIAFPMFWNLNAETRVFYNCVHIQEELNELIAEWREETGSESYKRITVEELRRRYEEKTGNHDLPTCPGDEPGIDESDKTQLYIGMSLTAQCVRHKFDYSYTKTDETSKPNTK